MNKQKGASNVLLIIIIVILVLVVGYFAFMKKSETALPEAQFPVSETSPSDDTQSPSKVSTSGNSAATLDLSSPKSKQYKTALTQGFKNPANFAEHYVVVSIGCGSGCFNYAVIDKNTGKVYFTPAANDLGNFVENGANKYTPFSLKSADIKIVVENGTKINTYRFDGYSFTLINTEQTSGNGNANFVVSPISGAAPLAVHFSFSTPSDWASDTTYNGGTSHQLKLYYGDGTSDFVIPGDCHACGGDHKYSSPGTYTAKLTKYNNYPTDAEKLVGTETITVR